MDFRKHPNQCITFSYSSAHIVYVKHYYTIHF